MAFLDNDDDVWGDDPTPEIVEGEVADTIVETPEVEAKEEATEGEVQQEQTAEEKFSPTLYREMKEERAKRQAAERELNELRAKVPAPTPQAPEKIPDAYEDPEGFNRYQEQKFAQTEWNLRASISERFAKQQHGEEAVKEATEWGLERAKGDPGFGQKVMAHPDPVGFTLQEFKRSRTLEALGDKSPEDFAREYAVSQGWIVSQPGTEVPIQKPSPAARAPRGLSNAPGSGGVKQAPNADWSEVKFALDR